MSADVCRANTDYGKIFNPHNPQQSEEVVVYGPTGEVMKTRVKNNTTVKQLKEKALKKLPGIPGQSEDNVRLTYNGKTLDDPLLLSKYGIRTSSVMHLVLRVHGG